MPGWSFGGGARGGMGVAVRAGHGAECAIVAYALIPFCGLFRRMVRQEIFHFLHPKLRAVARVVWRGDKITRHTTHCTNTLRCKITH